MTPLRALEQHVDSCFRYLIGKDAAFHFHITTKSMGWFLGRKMKHTEKSKQLWCAGSFPFLWMWLTLNRRFCAPLITRFLTTGPNLHLLFLLVFSLMSGVQESLSSEEVLMSRLPTRCLTALAPSFITGLLNMQGLLSRLVPSCNHTAQELLRES